MAANQTQNSNTFQAFVNRETYDLTITFFGDVINSINNSYHGVFQKGTPYEGGIFRVLIVYPSDYPNSRPEVNFLRPFPFHPNVHQIDGRMSMIILYNWVNTYDTTNSI